MECSQSQRKPVDYSYVHSTPKQASADKPIIPLSVIDTDFTDLEPIQITPKFDVIDYSTAQPKANTEMQQQLGQLQPQPRPKSQLQPQPQSRRKSTTSILQDKRLPDLPSNPSQPLSSTPSPSHSNSEDLDDFGPLKVEHTSIDLKRRQKQQNRKAMTSLLRSPNESDLDTKINREPQIKYPDQVDPSPLPPLKSSFLEPQKPTSARPATSSSLATQTPLASLYLVSGLPKDPAAWTYADEASVANVHHSPNAVGRWWRAETLGTSASPGISVPGLDFNGKKKRVGGMPKDEVNKVQAKALKLSFTQEVEIISSSLQPPSTMHSFSFSVASQRSNTGYTSNSINSQQSNSFNSGWANTQTTNDSKKYDWNNQTYQQPDPLGLNDQQPGVDRDGRKTYYGVVLQTWSHADPGRAHAIRKALSSRQRRAESLSQASTTDKREDLMQKRLNVNGNGGTDEASRNSDNEDYEDAEDDTATVGDTTDILSDVNDALPSQVGAGLAYEDAPLTGAVPEETLFWLPYSLTLVSTHPIYDVLADYLSISWAMHSRDISSHSATMKSLLEKPAPKYGEMIKLPAAGRAHKHRRLDEKDERKRKDKKKADSSLTVIARMPGAINFGQNLLETGFTSWPLFKCLSIENILTVCEIALAPTGRILFLSRYPQMLGVACLTLQYMVESRGWAGQVHQIVHARDYAILLEDPGQSIIGARTEVRYSLKPPAEVCAVDLDMNFVQCINPPSGYVSTGSQREKKKQKLVASFGTYRPDESVPSEFKEAFPSGRFMPLCQVESRGKAPSTIERVQAPYWWDPQSILGAFDSVLASRHRRPFSIMNLLTRSHKRLPRLSATEQKTQQAIRARVAQFVDSRDELETRIGKLNKRLGFLVVKSEQWKKRFEQFESYAERLSWEASHLRSKIDRERRESKRLSGMVIQQTKARDSLVNQLRQTEFLRAGALAELDVMQTQLRRFENERDDMVSHITTNLSDAIGQLDKAGQTSRSNSPWIGDKRYSHQKSNSLESAIPEEYAVDDDYVEKLSNDDDKGLSDSESRSTYQVQKTMSMIQNKLERALSDLEASRRQSMDEEAEPVQEKTEIIQKDLRNIQRSQQFIRQSQLLQVAKDSEDKLASVETDEAEAKGGSDAKEGGKESKESTTYARNSKRRSIHAPARLSLPPRNYHEYGDEEQKEFLFDSAANIEERNAVAEEYIKYKNHKKEFRKSLARLSQSQQQSQSGEEDKYMTTLESPQNLKGSLKKKQVKDIVLVRDGEKSEEEQTRNRSQALAFLEGKSTSSTRTAQLIALERNLASLVVKGKASEAEFERRMRGMRCLLEKLLISHLRAFTRDIPAESSTEISITLSILQGLSLLNGQCKRGLSTTAAMEILFELLNVSVVGSHSVDTTLVAADVLDALLCVIAGSTTAIRTLEHLRGLECIVRVLRRKGVDAAVRVKSLELLYFYLLPEKSETGEKQDDQPINKAIEHISDVPYSPKSPLKKHKSSYSIDAGRRPSRLRYISYGGGGGVTGGSSGSGSADEGREGRENRRKLAPTHTRSHSDLKVGGRMEKMEDIPPVPPIPMAHNDSLQVTQQQQPLPKTPEKKRSVPSSRMGTPVSGQAQAQGPRTPRTPRVNGEVRIPPPTTQDSTRSVDEKKIILGNWLGNVDALKVEINKQKANEETNSVPQLGALEEDDEFEEFEVDDWRDDECEVSNMATNDKLWQDSWDDDDQDDDFSHQLRAELQKTSGDMNMST
ncbi:hypothetical protein E3P81_03195 [Wallemia ichthyophaga]|nr:hypothetical protein E3P97_03275 [Wallemia ichthyophaga]TIB30028.1 hypothetical protein E3P85_02905 [Wallemia ichthyophaga]TIB44940.1 hypothetical protein E3P82_03220 [Wallemia ichthyophaga]TIB47599.1 hypothetical protein E3P81_03195 [Wallemia ichthyophaga]TIB50796.1 hypothetical protein E3P80_03204 [Wallemia ichthyophaga]